MLLPVILAGGVGSRLWPLSRAALPKQFIKFPQQEASLFQQTIERLDGIDGVMDPMLVCNSDHRFLVAEQLRQLNGGQGTILLEPVGRNTAPAVAMAALVALEQDKNSILLVLPADHLIADKQSFQHAVGKGVELAQEKLLVTFGIVPGAPETGYGYIEQGAVLDGHDELDAQENTSAFRVACFVEKPDREQAEAYLATGNYLWNSGMFLFRADHYLAELKKSAPDIYEACQTAYAALESDQDFLHIPATQFAACRSESIDYAVMEHTDQAAVIPLDAGWNDLGAWDALYEVAPKAADANVLSGDVVTTGVSNSYVQAESRLVAVAGLTDVVVVETADAVLVADKSQAQSVKQIVEQLQADGRSEIDTHALVSKPWGTYETVLVNDGFQVKHIIVNPGQSLSLQMHHQRSEHWTVIKGAATVTCDDREFSLEANESTFIAQGSKHRLANKGEIPVEFVEVQVGDYLGEDDIVRFDDQYGRAKS